MRRTIVVAALAALLAALPVVLAQDARDPIVAGAAAKIPAGLEKLLETAMGNNPDVRLAQAGVSQAQAVLNQTRLEVAQRVAGLFHERQSLKRTKAELAAEYIELKQRYENGVEPKSGVRQAALAQAQADAKLAQVEAEIRYVLGVGGAPRMTPDRPFVRGHSAGPIAKPAPTRPALKDANLDRQLQKTMEVAWIGTPIGQVVADLEGATGGELSFVLQGHIDHDEYEVTLRLSGKAKVSHVLSALADHFQRELCFVFRDYGVLVTDSDSARYLEGPTIPADIPLQSRFGD